MTVYKYICGLTRYGRERTKNKELYLASHTRIKQIAEHCSNFRVLAEGRAWEDRELILYRPAQKVQPNRFRALLNSLASEAMEVNLIFKFYHLK